MARDGLRVALTVYLSVVCVVLCLPVCVAGDVLTARGIVRLVAGFIEGQALSLGDGSVDAADILEFALQCTGHPDRDTAGLTFSIWSHFTDVLREDLKPRYEGLYLRLLQSLLGAVRLAEDRWIFVLAGTSCYDRSACLTEKDEGNTFRAYRTEVQEVVRTSTLELRCYSRGVFASVAKL